jgi:hypothetical protein
MAPSVPGETFPYTLKRRLRAARKRAVLAAEDRGTRVAGNPQPAAAWPREPHHAPGLPAGHGREEVAGGGSASRRRAPGTLRPRDKGSLAAPTSRAAPQDSDPTLAALTFAFRRHLLHTIEC